MPQALYQPQPGLFINNLTFGTPSGNIWTFKPESLNDQNKKAQLLRGDTVIDTLYLHDLIDPGATRWIFFQNNTFLIVRHQIPKEVVLYVYDLRQGQQSRRYKVGHGPFSVTSPNAQINFHPSQDGLAFFIFVSGDGLPNETKIHRAIRTDTGDLLCSWGSIQPPTPTELQRLAEITTTRKVRILTSPAPFPDGRRRWTECDLPSNPLPDVRIMDIRHNPPGPDIQGENVAIQNFETGQVTLTAWTLRDEAQHLFTFPASTLQAGATIRVWTKAGTNTSTDFFMGRSQAIWNNTGDRAFLRNEKGLEISFFSFKGKQGGGVMPMQPPQQPTGNFQLVSTAVVSVPEGVALPGGGSTNVVDTGVTLQPNQYVRVTAAGTIWAGVWLTGRNGPNGWEDWEGGRKFPLPQAHPYCLIGRFGDAPFFFVGSDSGRMRFTGTAPMNLCLGINDDAPGNGDGAFACTVEVFNRLP